MHSLEVKGKKVSICVLLCIEGNGKESLVAEGLLRLKWKQFGDC